MHGTEYGHNTIILGHFGTFVAVVTFSTPVAFWYTRNSISVQYTEHNSYGLISL